MTENLLQKLEEKVITLLAELEALRDEIKQLKHENFSLKEEKADSIQKLQGVVSLFDSLDISFEVSMQNEAVVS